MNHKVLVPVLILLLLLAVVVGVVLVDRTEFLVDVVQVEQPAGWLIV